MMNGFLLVFFFVPTPTPIRFPLFMTVTIQRPPDGNDACVRMRYREKDEGRRGAYYGNSGVMNVSEQVKLNLNCITCCFEYTSPICPSLMYYQVQPAELLQSPEFRGRGFKILSARNAKFMNPHTIPPPPPHIPA